MLAFNYTECGDSPLNVPDGSGDYLGPQDPEAVIVVCSLKALDGNRWSVIRINPNEFDTSQSQYGYVPESLASSGGVDLGRCTDAEDQAGVLHFVDQ